jgi:hypothetical protein
MYAIVEDNAVIKYGSINELFPNVSFPASGEYGTFVEDNGLYEVVAELEFDSATEKVVVCEPYIKNKKVYTVKKETISSEEHADFVNAAIDAELIATAWVDLDTTLSTANLNKWKKYRSDIEALRSSKKVSDIKWPDKPTVFPEEAK